MDIDRLQSVGLVIIRPKSTQSDRKSDLLKIFRPESVKILKKRRLIFVSRLLTFNLQYTVRDIRILCLLTLL